MSHYRKIDTKIWDDEKFRKLSNEGKFFFIYLLTSPHSTAWGAYVLDDLYIRADLGLSTKRINSCWAEVVKNGLVLRCEQTRLVCFPNWYSYNPPVNEKSAWACIRGIQALPKSLILSIFCKKSKWVSEQLANLNLTVSEKVEDEQGQEQEQEQEQEYNTVPVSEQLANLNLTVQEQEQEYNTVTAKNLRKKFIKPKLEEIRAYCIERKNFVDPQMFIDHYASNGWKVGKNPMKDWKAAIRTWEHYKKQIDKMNNKKDPAAGPIEWMDQGKDVGYKFQPESR